MCGTLFGVFAVSGDLLYNILSRTTREGKTVDLLIRGKPGDGSVCVSKGAAQWLQLFANV